MGRASDKGPSPCQVAAAGRTETNILVGFGLELLMLQILGALWNEILGSLRNEILANPPLRLQHVGMYHLNTSPIRLTILTVPIRRDRNTWSSRMTSCQNRARPAESS